MKNYQEYFIRVYEKGKGAEVKEEHKFSCMEEVFDWMQQNREELYVVFGSDCILDLS